ncbi:MAG TPA: fructosamine kinase family protein [Luteibaculaceae bacterium]|nr:fructosamine kinase family protein [Luteibaculaceae bacterium]
MQEIIQQIIGSQNLGKIKTIRPIPGGSINLGFHVKTTIGQYFLKMNDQVPDDYFDVEFNSLQIIDKYARTPRVMAHGKIDKVSFLVLEWIAPVSTHPSAIDDLAFSLAQLHRQTKNQFGFDFNNYIGSLYQRNDWADSWTDFYTQHRILPLVKLGLDNKLLTKDNVQSFEALCARFSQWMPAEKPALLHGDLWHGNYLLSGSKSYMIDPAIYYGHREMDIAMTHLFGSFPDRFYDVYNSSNPLQPGWQERIPLYQLYPLLVHLHLFGSSYYPQLNDVLIKFR